MADPNYLGKKVIVEEYYIKNIKGNLYENYNRNQ